MKREKAPAGGFIRPIPAGMDAFGFALIGAAFTALRCAVALVFHFPQNKKAVRETPFQPSETQ